MRYRKLTIALMLLTALCTMSCRSSRMVSEQRTTERQTNRTGDTLTVYIHTTDTLIVRDTVRETIIVQLNADGDTTRKDTQREHVTDRTSQQRNDSVRESTHQERHEKESTEDKKETVVERPMGNQIKTFLWGLVAGVGIIGIIGVIRIMKK